MDFNEYIMKLVEQRAREIAGLKEEESKPEEPEQKPEQTTGGASAVPSPQPVQTQPTTPDNAAGEQKKKEIAEAYLKIKQMMEDGELERLMYTVRDKTSEKAPSADLLHKPITTYPQDWPAYNQAQCQEKLLFHDILSELCQSIDEPLQAPHKGRPAISLEQMVFSCVNKVYEGLSSRRATSDLEIARRRGYLDHTPTFNTVLRYLNKPTLTPLLTSLIELSSLPLRGFEEVFAVDASGLSSAFYSRWLDYRFNGDRRFHDWMKIHVMIGTKTQIVTAIKVTDGHANDSPYLPTLLAKTQEKFVVKAVCADKGYSSKANVQAIWDTGALPLIPFKETTTGKSRGFKTWRKMWIAYQLDKERFYQHYHQRSLVEASFSALKRKFQGKLMLKNEIGKVNEALAMMLCYNICVLIHEAKKNGIQLDFEAAPKTQPPAPVMPNHQ